MKTDNPEQDAQDFMKRQEIEQDELTQKEVDEIKENYALLIKLKIN